MKQASVFSERKQNVGVPGAVQPQRLVKVTVTRAGIQPRGVDAEQRPRQVAGAPVLPGNPHYNGRAAGASVCARIGKKVAVAPEAQAE